MSAAQDGIVEEFRSLLTEEQGRLLEVLEQERRGSERANRNDLACGVREKYAHVATSSEDFIGVEGLVVPDKFSLRSGQ
jgi:hypothetical protein